MTSSPAGLPSALYTRLCRILMRCGPFESDLSLRAVFVDERLFPWRDELPEAANERRRVEALIHYLYGRQNGNGDDALLQFLQVLRDRVSANTDCYVELSELVAALVRESSARDAEGAGKALPDVPGTPFPQPRPTARWPRLHEHLTYGQLVLFVGGDLPQSITGLPSRSDLARALAKQYDLDPNLSLSEVAQRVSQGSNRFAYTSFIRQALDPASVKPQLFHQQIVELVRKHAIRLIVSTAYDDLLSRAFADRGLGVNRVVRSGEEVFVKPQHPTIIKLYGDWQQPDTLVITEDDHLGLWRNRVKENLLDQIQVALRASATLFLGYNLADHDFKLIWRHVLDRMGQFSMRGYAVWPGLAQDIQQVWAGRHVQVLDVTVLDVLSELLLEDPQL